MKTDDFISLLASGIAPVDHHTHRKRFSVAVLVGAAGATLIMAMVLGIRRDLAERQSHRSSGQKSPDALFMKKARQMYGNKQITLNKTYAHI
ncbi:NrsF family protein [Paraburkholderia fungorum]|uniref:NrsF family protein n=1 Tax=Paraburkholderia fungorum TaxID=134537 RepID=UPI0038B844DB